MRATTMAGLKGDIMTKKEKCMAIIDLMALCKESEIVEEDIVIGEFIDKVYNAIEKNGSLDLMTRVMSLGELNNILSKW